MDGASGSRGSSASPRRENIGSQRDKSEQVHHAIFVRAHTSVRTKNRSDRRRSPKWPEHCLIFDTETTLDSIQKLNFGAYRRCKLVGDKYVCEAEGIFYRDDLPQSQMKLLQRYKS